MTLTAIINFRKTFFFTQQRWETPFHFIPTSKHLRDWLLHQGIAFMTFMLLDRCSLTNSPGTSPTPDYLIRPYRHCHPDTSIPTKSLILNIQAGGQLLSKSGVSWPHIIFLNICIFLIKNLMIRAD